MGLPHYVLKTGKTYAKIQIYFVLGKNNKTQGTFPPGEGLPLEQAGTLPVAADPTSLYCLVTCPHSPFLADSWFRYYVTERPDVPQGGHCLREGHSAWA